MDANRSRLRRKIRGETCCCRNGTTVIPGRPEWVPGSQAPPALRKTPRNNGAAFIPDGEVAIELHAQTLHGPQVYSGSCPFVLERAMAMEAKTDIVEYLGRQHEAMVALLADLVNIDSGSYNKRGVDAVGDRLRAHLETAGVVCETIPDTTYG